MPKRKKGPPRPRYLWVEREVWGNFAYRVSSRPMDTGVDQIVLCNTEAQKVFPGVRPGQTKRFAVVAAALAVLIFGACAPSGQVRNDPYPAEEVEYVSWYVEITSSPGQTLTARVSDTRSGRAIRVWAGQTAALPLTGEGSRTLEVEIGSTRFRTMDFYPTDFVPCWRLYIDSTIPYTLARGGPHPCPNDDNRQLEER